MRQKNRLRSFNRLLFLIHGCFSVLLGVYRVINGQLYFALLAAASVLMLLLPHIFFRIFHMRPVPQAVTIAYLYCILSFTVGMALQAYHRIPYYDKLLHTLSGIFFAFLGLIFYHFLRRAAPGGKNSGKKAGMDEFPLISVFTFCFSITVAAVWEIYEYVISLISTLDPQNVLTHGVHDTMQDILVCLLGTALFLIPEYLYFKKGIKDLFLSCYEALTAQN